jgi:beta-N-acetylhexosaminidase
MKRFFLLTILLPLLSPAQEQDSLDIKIGQMIIMGLDNFNTLDTSEFMFDDIRKGTLGNVIVYTKHINSKSPVKSLQSITSHIQEIAPMPVFIGIDEEGGRVNRLKPKYGFPETRSAQYLGELGIEDSTRFYARSAARELANLGINMNFAPDVDVNINPKNPVIGSKERSYSGDHKIVSEHAGYMIDEQSKKNVVNVLKHFPGHGSSTSDTHLGIADVSDSWRLEELFPYRTLMDDGKVQAIMTAHIVNKRLDESQKPATLSKKIITDLLRGFMGYDGLIISDDMQMHAISKHYGFEESIVLCINAGVDMLMFANNTHLAEKRTPLEIHAMIKQNVISGNIPISRIDESFDRIMKVKNSLK